MKQFSIIFLAVMTLFFFQACKKKSNPSPANSNVNQNLLKTWKVSKALESSSSADISAEYASYKITFQAEGGSKQYTLVNRQGTSKTGVWVISTDETKITLTPTGGASTSLTNVSIGANELKYETLEKGKTGEVKVLLTLIPE